MRTSTSGVCPQGCSWTAGRPSNSAPWGLSELHAGKINVAKGKLAGTFKKLCMYTAYSINGSCVDVGSFIDGLRELGVQPVQMGHSTIQQEGAGQDWDAVVLRMQGYSILLVQIYLTNGLGPAQDNLVKMHEVESCIRAVGLPAVVAGDWNMEPDGLSSSGWMDRVDGQLATPQGTAATCANGGRLTD